INHEALSEALQDQKVLYYVTDFPNHQLKNHPHVISLPHLGASTREAEENCAVMVVKQIRHFLENGSVKNAVNLPNLEAPTLTSGLRLSIVNANIPNMVAQISSVLANAKLNITSLLNKSLHEMAYTLIDVGSEMDDMAIQQIKNIQGVMQVRVI